MTVIELTVSKFFHLQEEIQNKTKLEDKLSVLRLKFVLYILKAHK